MKNSLLIIVVSFASITAYAQAVVQEDNSRMQIGISIGPNVTHTVNFSGYDGEVKFTPRRIRYSAALHIQYKFSRVCALRTELFFERKRVHYRDWFGYYNNYHTNSNKFIDEDRVELPLFFRAYVQRFFTEAGIYLGYKYGSRETDLYYSYNGDKKNVTNKEKREYYKYGFDIDGSLYKGICLGVGYDVINRKKISFSISVRDDLELSELGRNYLNYNTINLLWGVLINFNKTQMKTLISTLLAFLAVLICLSSCSTINDVVSTSGIVKRKYRKGYYVQQPRLFSKQPQSLAGTAHVEDINGGNREMQLVATVENDPAVVMNKSAISYKPVSKLSGAIKNVKNLYDSDITDFRAFRTEYKKIKRDFRSNFTLSGKNSDDPLGNAGGSYGVSIASLASAILGLIVAGIILGSLAMLLGILALVNKKKGKIIAIAGIALGLFDIIAVTAYLSTL